MAHPPEWSSTKRLQRIAELQPEMFQKFAARAMEDHCRHQEKESAAPATGRPWAAGGRSA